jgi:hypothetical protein
MCDLCSRVHNRGLASDIACHHLIPFLLHHTAVPQREDEAGCVADVVEAVLAGIAGCHVSPSVISIEVSGAGTHLCREAGRRQVRPGATTLQPDRGL